MSVEVNMQLRGKADLIGAVINDANVQAGSNIDADKVQACHKPSTNFDLAIGGTPVTREELVFVASRACEVKAFACLLAETGTSTDIDFDLKKNGTTVLSSVVNITEGTSDGVVTAGSLSGTVTLAADDRLSIAMTVTSATGAQGPFAWAEVHENAT